MLFLNSRDDALYHAEVQEVVKRIYVIVYSGMHPLVHHVLKALGRIQVVQTGFCSSPQTAAARSDTSVSARQVLVCVAHVCVCTIS